MRACGSLLRGLPLRHTMAHVPALLLVLLVAGGAAATPSASCSWVANTDYYGATPTPSHLGACDCVGATPSVYVVPACPHVVTRACARV